jgi:serine phosphatase RsbU (regulator of sigma subunit)/CHASE2 domain-containing sensor protein
MAKMRATKIGRFNLWAKLTPVERRLFVRIFLTGVMLTAVVLVADGMGMLANLERWLYDKRAENCQFFTPPPSDQLVHLDIDDKAVDAIGRWPWPRSRMARIVEEIGRAKPKALAIDVLYAEPEEVEQPDRTMKRSPGDGEFAAQLSTLDGVVIPVSLLIDPPRALSSVESAIAAELQADLELTEPELLARLRTRGFTVEDVGPHYAARYLEARRAAVYDRLRAETSHGPVTLDELYPRLLPRADATLHSPLRRLVAEQYVHVMAVREMAKHGVPLPEKMRAPVQSGIKAVPLPEFTRASDGVGFVDFEIFSEATVRSMPLLVEHDKVLYPQFGVTLACHMLGADVRQMRFTSSGAIIPRENAADVQIPLRSYYSRRLGRSVPLMMDIPFFGGERWQTMYDWPKQEAEKAHLSLGMVWDICLTREKIVRNNAAVDKAISIILGDAGPALTLDPALAKKYAAQLPDPEDVQARREIIAKTRKELTDSKWLEQFASVKDAELKPEERLMRDELRDADLALSRADEENAKLKAQLDGQRKELTDAIKSKGVLIGWTATGAADVVTTSLHARCPGVVVHGVIANAVLTGNWWRTAPLWIAPAFTILLGLLTAGAVGYHAPFKAALAAIALLFGYLLLNGVVIFDYGDRIVAAAGPVVAIATVWAGCGLMRVTYEALERIRTARDLAVFKHEMELARSVQQALIPKKAPAIPGLEPHGWTKPADMTGGDCFDLWKLPDGRLGILLADASGHGLAPSIIVSQVRALVRAISEIETHPDKVLDRVNARVAADLEPGRFATAFLGFLSTDGELQWASAGHGPQLWCDVSKGTITEFDSTGLPLGVTEEWVGDIAPPLQLMPTGMLIVFSDGIFEAPSPAGPMFGVERVTEIIDRLRDAPAADIVAAVREAVTKWQGKDVPHDDQTTVVVRRLEVAVVTTSPEGYRAVVAAHADSLVPSPVTPGEG